MGVRAAFHQGLLARFAEGDAANMAVSGTPWSHRD